MENTAEVFYYFIVLFQIRKQRRSNNLIKIHIINYHIQNHFLQIIKQNSHHHDQNDYIDKTISIHRYTAERVVRAPFQTHAHQCEQPTRMEYIKSQIVLSYDPSDANVRF